MNESLVVMLEGGSGVDPIHPIRREPISSRRTVAFVRWGGVTLARSTWLEPVGLRDDVFSFAPASDNDIALSTSVTDTATHVTPIHCPIVTAHHPRRNRLPISHQAHRAHRHAQEPECDRCIDDGKLTRAMDVSNLPYKARQPRSRPNRPLPAPPPEEDVPAQNAFEIVQGFTSPPSPPKAPSRPPPPVDDDDEEIAQLGESVTHTHLASGSGLGAGESAPAARTRPPVPKSSARIAAQHINPFHSTLPSAEMVPPTILTPLRAHYLKKTLVNQQIHYELDVITDPRLGAAALGLLGSPFTLPESAKNEVLAVAGTDGRATGARVGDLPFIRFMFHQFLLPFPFLAAAPPTFWNAKVQPFLSSWLATTGVSQHQTITPQEREVTESLMTKEEKKEAEERRKLWTKVEKHLGLMISVGIKLAGGEEVVRIGQSELRRIEEAQQARRKKYAEKMGQVEMLHFDVNVVGVRTVKERGHVRSKHHEVSRLGGGKKDGSVKRSAGWADGLA